MPTMPEWLGVLIAFIYGTVVGSFLNVCIWRLPRDESIIQPGSHCPHCQTLLRPWDLIPLFSFLLQRCRCKYCGAPISWRYFGVELITGIYFALTYHWFGPRAGYPPYWIVDFFAYALFGASLIAIFFIDLEHYIIPDQLSLFGIAVGFLHDVVKIITGTHQLAKVPIPFTSLKIPLPASVVGIVVCGGSFLLLAIVSYYVFRKEAMGGGDIKLAAAIGANVALGAAMLSFLLAVFIGGIIGIGLIVFGKKTRKDYVPFGPMMVAGAFIVVFYGTDLLRLFEYYVCNYIYTAY